MTLPARFCFSKISNNNQNNLTTMKAFALMVFLLLFLISGLAHAEHLVQQDINPEQQDCHICSQGIDTPPKLLQIKTTNASLYGVVVAKDNVIQTPLSSFVQPPSRAPPFIQ